MQYKLTSQVDMISWLLESGKINIAKANIQLSKDIHDVLDYSGHNHLMFQLRNCNYYYKKLYF